MTRRCVRCRKPFDVTINQTTKKYCERCNNLLNNERALARARRLGSVPDRGKPYPRYLIAYFTEQNSAMAISREAEDTIDYIVDDERAHRPQTVELRFG